MSDMQKMYGNMFGGPAFPGENTLILNSGNDIVKRIIETANDEGAKEKRELIANYIYDLALLAHKPLKPEEMTEFIGRSTKLLQNML
jgi:molecular chaperone HtpG